MYRFLVPYRLHAKGAKTKASVHYLCDHDGSNMRPAPGAKIVEFFAETLKEGEKRLKDVILPGDPREVIGRTQVRRFQGESGGRGYQVWAAERGNSRLEPRDCYVDLEVAREFADALVKQGFNRAVVRSDGGVGGVVYQVGG